MIKVVTFDATNTLIRLSKPVGAIYGSVFRDVGRLEVDDHELTNLFNSNFKRMDRQFPCYGYGEMRVEDWWRKMIEGMVGQVGGGEWVVDDIFNSLSSQFGSNSRWWEKVEGADHLLTDIGRMKNVKIGVVSNFPSTLPIILSCLFPSSYHVFSHISTSHELGRAKV